MAIGQIGTTQNLGPLGNRLIPDKAGKASPIYRLAEIESPPDTGPESIEEDFESLNSYSGDVCNALMTSINDLNGETAIFRKMITSTRAIVRQRDYAEELISSDESDRELEEVEEDGFGRSDEITRMREYYKAMDFMAEHGIPYEIYDADELFVLLELAEAIYHSHKYVNSFDSKGFVSYRFKTRETVMAGVQANRHFLDFFIKMDERFEKLDPDQLRELFRNVFKNYDLRRMFESNALSEFPAGVYAGLEAYLHLKEEGYGKPPRGLKVSSISQDMDQGIDLVEYEEDEDGSTHETALFDIKGVNQRYTDLNRVLVLDVSDPSIAFIYKQFVLTMQVSTKNKERRLKDIENFEEVVAELRAENPDMECRSILVPVDL